MGLDLPLWRVVDGTRTRKPRAYLVSCVYVTKRCPFVCQASRRACPPSTWRTYELSVCVSGKPSRVSPVDMTDAAHQPPQLIDQLHDQHVKEGEQAVFKCCITATPGTHHGPWNTDHITDHAPRIVHCAACTTHHAPRNTHHTPRTTHHLPLAMQHAPRTTHHSLCTMYHAPCTMYRTPRITHRTPHTAHRASTHHGPRTTHRAPRTAHRAPPHTASKSVVTVINGRLAEPLVQWYYGDQPIKSVVTMTNGRLAEPLVQWYYGDQPIKSVVTMTNGRLAEPLVQWYYGDQPIKSVVTMTNGHLAEPLVQWYYGDQPIKSVVTMTDGRLAEPLVQWYYGDQPIKSVVTVTDGRLAEPLVQWYYGDQPIKPSKYFQMCSEQREHSLVIAGAFPEDEGVYKCIARNQSGEVTCIAHLSVTRESTLTQPSRFIVIAEMAVFNVAGYLIEERRRWPVITPLLRYPSYATGM